MTYLWSGDIKDISVLPGCCFLQVLPKAGTLRMKGSSSKSCGFQKRTLRCKDADAALNFLHRRKPRRKKIPWAAGLRNLMSQLYKCPVAQDWPRKPVTVHLPKHCLLREWAFSCIWGTCVFKALLLCFGLLFSTELLKTNFNDIFVRICSQWMPFQAKFCNTSTKHKIHVFCKYVCV